VNALWQSEVVLSRSGNRQSMKRDDDDGRLYGMELMMWDLSNLDLLVLSACETARGQETFVGGLRGLPTAINIAGAKRSLLALWPVDDAGTAAFMVSFYGHLAAGRTYPEALRQARRDAATARYQARRTLGCGPPSSCSKTDGREPTLARDRSVQADRAGRSAVAGLFCRMSPERCDPFACRKACRRCG
jgi:hypothetical protein